MSDQISNPISDEIKKEEQDVNLTDPDVTTNPDNQDADGQPWEEGEDSQWTDYEAKFKESQKEWIRLYKEQKKASEEKKFLTNVNKVYKDNEKLHEIYDEDPELAEKISQEVHGISYNEVSNDSKADDSSDSETDVATLVRKELDKQNAEKESEKIEELEVNFLTEKGLVPWSVEYKNIMETYNWFTPKTSKEAAKILWMAYAFHKGGEESYTPPVTTSFGSWKTPNTAFDSQEYWQLKASMQAVGVSLTKEEYIAGKKAWTI